MLALALLWPALGTVALGTGIYFARRYVRAIERGGANETALAELRQRLADLESAVDGTRRDVERLEEGQAFTDRLLTERAPGGR